MDVVKLVEKGLGNFEYHTIYSTYKDYTLKIKVFRDAMKFDAVPGMKFNRTPNGKAKTYDGVRLPASAYELQEIADLLNCMLLTPKVIDLIWLQAELKFDAIINIKGQIVAISNIEDVHEAIENKIKSLGGDDGTKLVSCVGKYWCLTNQLQYYGMLHGAWTCCNYGWCAVRASGPGILPGVQCWQRPGYRHGGTHLDPSQTIRLMHKIGILEKPDGNKEKVNLQEIAQDSKLFNLITHGEPLKYLRQKGPELKSPLISLDLNPDLWKIKSGQKII